MDIILNTKLSSEQGSATGANWAPFTAYNRRSHLEYAIQASSPMLSCDAQTLEKVAENAI